MRAGVLVAIGGTVAVLVATGPASAFNSDDNPEAYFGPAVSAVNDHREWASETRGTSYQPADGFTPRLPDDEFDSLLLNMINRFRSDNGVPPFQESEGLRVQSAMWSNVIADLRNDKAVDWWSSQDVAVACGTVTDLYGTSAVSDGRPEDVFDEWTATPAVRTALLVPGPSWAGIASVVDNAEWTTIRIVQGDCGGGGLPYEQPVALLPEPRIAVRVSPWASTLAVTVHRRGDDQLWVELQQHDGQHWMNAQTLYLAPREPSEPVAVSAGRYRVTVPEQSGYAGAFTEPITVP